MKTIEEAKAYVDNLINELRKIDQKYAKIYNLDLEKMKEAHQIIRQRLLKYLVEKYELKE